MRFHSRFVQVSLQKLAKGSRVSLTSKGMNALPLCLDACEAKFDICEARTSGRVEERRRVWGS